MSIYNIFYTQFIPDINNRVSEFPIGFKIPKHQDGRAYLAYNTGKGRVQYYSEYTSRGYSAGYNGFIVGVYMDGPLYEERFQYLKNRQSEIETQVGSPLIWLNTGRAGRIFFYLNEDISDKTKWSDIITWEIDKLQKVVEVFKPYIREL